MKKTLIKEGSFSFPERINSLVFGKPLYDSSSSPEARVFFSEAAGGIFIKRAAKGSLKKEAEMTDCFNRLGLAPCVIDYFTADFDYLLTARAEGEDATHFTSDPKWLSRFMGQKMRELHDTAPSLQIPVKNRTGDYLALAEKNYKRGIFDGGISISGKRYTDASSAYADLARYRGELNSDCLIHGDYCLPNIIINKRKLSAYVDLGGAGMGDRHIDLFWGIWTLNFNLGTFDYTDELLDAYGRDKVNPNALIAIAAAECFG